jgi:putative sterol carrier protein
MSVLEKGLSAVCRRFRITSKAPKYAHGEVVSDVSKAMQVLKKEVEMPEVSENVTVKEYFEEVVPQIFEEEMSKQAISGMEGTEFTVEFDIEGKSYGLNISDAKSLKVFEGPLDNPMLKVKLNEDTWRKAVTGKIPGAMDMFMDMGQMANRRRYDTLASTKGAIDVELGMPDGNTEQLSITFNGSESPKVIFKAALEDWAKVSSGEIPGPTAFMSGKLKIDGDMSFAMALGNLMT